MRNDETKYNEIVGIKNNQIYVLEYIFEDNKFKGAVGYSMEPLYSEDIEIMMDIDDYDDYEYLWKDAVKNGCTYLGFEDYIEEIKEQSIADGRYGINDDDSFRYEFREILNNSSESIKNKIKEIYTEDVINWNCVGCGRCFDKNMEWDIIFNQKLIDEINIVEGE